LKVAVSSTGPDLDAVVSPRFGRCPYFVIVETATMNHEAIPNTSASKSSGAGIAASQEVANRGIDAVLSGRFGPNASQALSQVGIRMMTGANGTVKQTVEAFKNGGLNDVSSSSVGQGIGYGRGMGMGIGMGMGRGLGRGMGRDIYNPGQQPTPPPSSVPTSRDEEKEILMQHLTELERQLKEVRKRMEELK
jgi:predicted Fe-Mo cluster-binding NifX family protein